MKNNIVEELLHLAEIILICLLIGHNRIKRDENPKYCLTDPYECITSGDFVAQKSDQNYFATRICFIYFNLV